MNRKKIETIFEWSKMKYHNPYSLELTEYDSQGNPKKPKLI